MARFTVVDSPPAMPDKAESRTSSSGLNLSTGTPTEGGESTKVSIKKEKRRSWLRPNLFKRTKPSKTHSTSTPIKTSADEESLANLIDTPIKQEQPRMVSSRPSRIRRFNMQKPQRAIWKRKTMTRYEISILIIIALPLIYMSVIKDYHRDCDTRIPHLITQNIQRELAEKLFGQDIAMHNLTRILKTHSGLTTLNFVGSCGTGKSFTANLMAKHFEEFHPYHWGAEQEDDEMHVRLLQDHILSLTQCQPSLVVVDNLSSRQKPHVEDLHRWLMNNSRWNRVNLVVVFIFTVDRYDGDVVADQQMQLDTMGGLQDSNLVIFKSFQEGDGRDFLTKKIGVQLNFETIEDIVRHANVPRYGLKKLAHKFHVN